VWATFTALLSGQEGNGRFRVAEGGRKETRKETVLKITDQRDEQGDNSPGGERLSLNAQNWLSFTARYQRGDFGFMTFVGRVNCV
jgi:hypothetical protein